MDTASPHRVRGVVRMSSTDPGDRFRKPTALATTLATVRFGGWRPMPMDHYHRRERAVHHPPATGYGRPT